MDEIFVYETIFDRNDFTQLHLTKGEYENCSFNSCDFTESNLTEFKFIDCKFNGCNLSLAKIDKTTFRDAKFKECKMLGLRFDKCNEFGLSFSFDNCQLNHSIFYKVKLKNVARRGVEPLFSG
jgi:fluoroquinolone resistance protein